MEEIDEYIQRLNSQISTQINSKIKIYLDTKYWIDICDATKNNINKNSTNKKLILEIYILLKELVKSNKIICPISPVIFNEVLKQKDEKSLKHTAKIIDELSNNITICHENERIHLELFNFFYDIYKIETIEQLRNNFWRNGIMNVYGTNIPYNNHLDKYINLFIQKNFLNELYSYKLLDFIEKIGIENLKIYRENKIDIKWFNYNKQKYIKKISSFRKLYMSEIVGVINDFYKKDIETIFSKVINKKTKINEITLKEFDSNIGLNIIYTFFDKKLSGNYLPTIDIGAMLHSKLLWNTTQKYKQGDIDDIRHAVTALPYYDYFFTERSLHNMVNESKYNKKYSCKVASNYNDVLNLLKSI